MRARIVPVALVLVILALISFGLLYLRTQGLLDSSAHTLTPDATPSVSPLTSTSPSSALGSVPPTVPVDLSVNANGLSKSTVILKTEKGEIHFKFYSDDAPKTVHRLVELIQKHFYDGLTFHRIEPGSFIQGGDPTGTGAGGSGQNLKAEFNKRRHIEGTVSLAHGTDPDSGDSQFFICLSANPSFDRSYTVFGQVIRGMDVAKKIEAKDKIVSITLE